jgi:hypothetical protein
VEYVAEANEVPVRVLAKNWRRKVTVEVLASAEAMSAVYGQMVFAGLKAD